MSEERLTAVALAQASLVVVYGEDGCGRYGEGMKSFVLFEGGRVVRRTNRHEDWCPVLAAAN